MEKTGKRGKIPQSDWPLIMVRYEQGETLSSIARTYDCSPPAISYIVSRSRSKSAGEAAEAAPIDLSPAKTPAEEVETHGSAPLEPTVETPAPVAASRSEPAATPRPTPINGAAAKAPEAKAAEAKVAEAKGAQVGAQATDTITAAASAAPPPAVAPPNGDQRRTLHLSHGNNGANGNGNPSPGNGNGHTPEPSGRPSLAVPRPPQPQLSGNGQRMPQTPRNTPPFDAGRHSRDLFSMPEGSPAAQQPREAETARKEVGNFIDQELRNRVDGDIAAFLAAFDAALAADTHESRFGLREATDRLLRAGARTRIELERLEARVPLGPREGGAQAQQPAWRYR